MLFLAVTGGGSFHAGFFTVFADRDPAYELLLEQLGFPETYYEKLVDLHKQYPNWAFLPYKTGLTWDEALEGESGYRVNLTPNTGNYPTAFHATEEVDGNITFDFDRNAFVVMSAPYWVQASEEAIAYYMDPRNFLNEDEIFQFEYLAENPMQQTIDGVEKIFSGSFLSRAYVVKPTLYISDGFVSGIEPDMKKEEVLAMLSCDPEYRIRIWNADHTPKEDGAYIGTGDVITVSAGELLWGEDELPQDYIEPEYSTFNCVVYGDLDGNGMHTKRDYLFFKRHYKQYYLLEGPYLRAADADWDGDIDNRDRLFVKRAAYGYYPLEQREVTGTERKPDTPLALYGADGMTYAECLLALSEEYGVSPYMLAVRLRQEQGSSGTSALISGDVEGYEGYYNYYNFGASGVTEEEILRNGLNYAKESGWDSPVNALRGGAERIVEKYISAKQNTLYLQKFNVVKDGPYALYRHQYMQNLLAARNEGVRTAKVYEELGCKDNGYIFYIPVYENMPKEPAPKPAIDGNPNAYLQMLTIEEVETLEAETVATEKETGEDLSETSSETELSTPVSGEVAENESSEAAGTKEGTLEDTIPERTLPCLEPTFSRTVFSYEVHVDANVKSITFDAQAIANVFKNPEASGRGEMSACVDGAGKKDLSFGENTFSIRVTAGNGNVLTYEIHVFREQSDVSETSTLNEDPTQEASESAVAAEDP